MLVLLLAALVAAPPAGNGAAETLLRAAAYDRNFAAKTPEGFRLGVVYDADIPASHTAAERFANEADALRATGSELAPVALYVPADMDEHVRSIAEVSEAAGVFTFAGAPADVERGLVLGLHVGDGSKKLVVNMAAAERAGVDFDAVVRQLAQRVGDAPAKQDRTALQQTLSRYTEAIEERDLAALRGIWPALKGDDEKRIVASFEMTRTHSVFFAVLNIDHQGQRAQARVRRTDKLVTRDGQVVTAGSLVEITFSKVGDGVWQIDSMAKANPVS